MQIIGSKDNQYKLNVYSPVMFQYIIILPIILIGKKLPSCVCISIHYI